MSQFTYVVDFEAGINVNDADAFLKDFAETLANELPGLNKFVKIERVASEDANVTKKVLSVFSSKFE